MSTIRIEDKKQTLIIAHRGLSGRETENTNAAFVAAGNRSHVGIETDVHKTADGQFVLIHDDVTGRVCDTDIPVEGSTFDALRALTLKQKNGVTGRTDIRIPSLEEYIDICKDYDKTAVLEFKNRFEKEDIAVVVRRIDERGWVDRTIFISFWYENLTDLQDLFPDANIQFLSGVREDLDWLIDELASRGFGLDIHHSMLTADVVAKCHNKGVVVNCWTVDELDRAVELVDMGVDYITSNILE
ncbi:MAG: hypothetical protein IKV35_03375 [Clostridia bacterium]|nr:hypothetical protein [Clostridia bacterium]